MIESPLGSKRCVDYSPEGHNGSVGIWLHPGKLDKLILENSGMKYAAELVDEYKILIFLL